VTLFGVPAQRKLSAASNDPSTLYLSRLTQPSSSLDAPEVIPGELIDTPAVVPTPSYTVVPTSFTTPTIIQPEPTTTPAIITTSIPFAGNTGANGGSKQVSSAGGLYWGVITMAAISGLVWTLIPRLV
jgi:hypothetical protein